jgi:hypothetical protein
MKTRKLYLLILLVCGYTVASAQQGNWVAHLTREDGNNIIFTFEWKSEKGKSVWFIKNAAEIIKVDKITTSGDSVFVQMPVFESQFRFVLKDKNIDGIWLKRGAVKTQVLPFFATLGNSRFATNLITQKNITGRWAVNFSGNKTGEISVAEFVQKGNVLTWRVLFQKILCFFQALMVVMLFYLKPLLKIIPLSQMECFIAVLGVRKSGQPLKTVKQKYLRNQ